jgi:hypothetical protein
MPGPESPENVGNKADEPPGQTDDDARVDNAAPRLIETMHDQDE